jgi:hypothetical protein
MLRPGSRSADSCHKTRGFRKDNGVLKGSVTCLNLAAMPAPQCEVH